MKRFCAILLLLWLSCVAMPSAFAAAPAMTYPASGSTLPGDSLGFSWAANGTAATSWQLLVGSSSGASNYYNSGTMSASTTYKYVDSVLPTNGSTVYVRLRYLVGSTWTNLNYTYIAAATKPAITGPTPGSTLTSSNTTFTWKNNGLTAIDQWWVDIGTTVDAYDIYSRMLAPTVVSQVVGMLPTDGRTLYVSLGYRQNGSWQKVRYTYKAFTGSPAPDPAITSPTPGSTLSSSKVTFSWSSFGTPVNYWYLFVGKTVGGSDYGVVSQSDGKTTGSATVSALPADGSTVYVRLYYSFPGYGSQYKDYTYTAGAPPQPSITSPTPGSVLNGADVNFIWTADGMPVTNWQLWVGTAAGASDILNSGDFPAMVTSSGAATLPMDGSTAYVRLRWLLGTTWSYKDYTYTTRIAKPAMTTPTAGSVLAGEAVTFAWTADGVPVTNWQLLVGKAVGASDIFNSGDLTPAIVNTEVTKLPKDGSTVYVRLRYLYRGVWSSLDYTYTAYMGNPGITAPAAGSTLPGATATFAWTADGLPITRWQLLVGTTAGAADILTSGDLVASTISKEATTLPMDGSTAYVRLRWLLNGKWYNKDYTYTAYTAHPAITAPTPDSTLSGMKETFTWVADGVPVTNWQLLVGKSVDASDIFNSGDLAPSTLSKEATTLPMDGSTVYVRLCYLYRGVWSWVDYTYTAATGKPEITSPVPGSTLTGSATEFVWAADGLPVTNWQLLVGKSVGASDILNSGNLPPATRSQVASNLPRDGSTLYVRLRWLFKGTWYGKDYTYIAYTGQPAMTSPADGTALPGKLMAFAWTADGLPVENWQLLVGKSSGSGEFHNSGTLAAGTASATVTALPKDGSTVQVRLRWLFKGTWYSRDYAYSAALGDPTITLPATGSTLRGASVTFRWTADELPVTSWQLLVGRTTRGSDIHHSGDLPATALSRTVSGLPLDGSTVAVTLRYLFGGTWYSKDYAYTAQTGDDKMAAAFESGKTLAATTVINKGDALPIHKDGATGKETGMATGATATDALKGPNGVSAYSTSPTQAGLYADGKQDLSGNGIGKQAACTAADTAGFAGKECDAINFLGGGRPEYPLDKADYLFLRADAVTRDASATAGMTLDGESGGCITTTVKNPDLEAIEHCAELREPLDKLCRIGLSVKVDKKVLYQCEVTTKQKVASECHKKLTVTCTNPGDGCDTNGVTLGAASSDMKWEVAKSSGYTYITFGTVADNYWGNGTYDRSATFNIAKMSAVSLFTLDHAWFDDWLWVKINGNTVYVGPYGGDRVSPVDEWRVVLRRKTGTWLRTDTPKAVVRMGMGMKHIISPQATSTITAPVFHRGTENFLG